MASWFTAPSPPAFSPAIIMVRRKGTISLVGLPPGDFQTPMGEVVMRRITFQGSIVGGGEDLAEVMAFAAEGKVRSQIRKAKLEDINQIFDDLKSGKVDGRVVIMMCGRARHSVSNGSAISPACFVEAARDK
jgi:alcohol dehydrogenase, propanol-preferring